MIINAFNSFNFIKNYKAKLTFHHDTVFSFLLFVSADDISITFLGKNKFAGENRGIINVGKVGFFTIRKGV